MGNTFRYEY